MVEVRGGDGGGPAPGLAAGVTCIGSVTTNSLHDSVGEPDTVCPSMWEGSCVSETRAEVREQGDLSVARR